MAKRFHSDEGGTGLTSSLDGVLDEYGRFLRNTIAHLCPKDLGLHFDDILQEARVRLWRALEREREIPELASYIYRIAVTTTIDAVRRVKSRREVQLHLAGDDSEEADPLVPVVDPVARPADSPERTAERRQVLEKVAAALARMSEQRRRAVGLHLQGLTTQEIADLLGWTEPKTRNLVYRGLNELRQQLQVEGVDYEIE